MFKKSLLALMLAAAGPLIGLAPTAASAQYAASIRIAPPPPIQEAVPADRPGFVWAPGHYMWRGDHYVWTRGHWLRERSGYAYQQPRWVQRDNGEWALLGGDWVPSRDRFAQRRDRDDRYGYDRDYRRDRQDRDRDDVARHRERDPNEPSRY